MRQILALLVPLQFPNLNSCPCVSLKPLNVLVVITAKFSTTCVSFWLAGGGRRRGVSRPQRPGGQPRTQHYRRGIRSDSKESTPPRDLDLVTKRMLSARLLKINELRNSLSELQQRTDELQKENRVLRQVDLTPLSLIA